MWPCRGCSFEELPTDCFSARLYIFTEESGRSPGFLQSGVRMFILTPNLSSSFILNRESIDAPEHISRPLALILSFAAQGWSRSLVLSSCQYQTLRHGCTFSKKRGRSPSSTAKRRFVAYSHTPRLSISCLPSCFYRMPPASNCLCTLFEAWAPY